MDNKELIETLEQVIEQLAFYKSLGIQSVDRNAWPGDPGRAVRLLTRLIESVEQNINMSLTPPHIGAVALPGSGIADPESRPIASVQPAAADPASGTNPFPNRRAGLLFDWSSEAADTLTMGNPSRTVFDTLPKNDSLESTRQDLGDCRRCKLCRTRTNIVFGSGSAKAELMLIGEGPGADEDAQGLPFVGRAGQLLTKMLEAIDLSRDQVYITNIVKCRPPENRKPEADEVDPCSPFLLRQINAIKPKLICALGGTAAQAMLKTKEGITSLRGRVFDFYGYKLLPTFHPAYLLRNPGDKRLVWEDMQKIRDYLRGRLSL